MTSKFTVRFMRVEGAAAIRCAHKVVLLHPSARKAQKRRLAALLGANNEAEFTAAVNAYRMEVAPSPTRSLQRSSTRRDLSHDH